MIGAIFLYFVCFEFFHLLVHLLIESILLSFCISEGDSYVLGCRCFAFFEGVSVLAHFLQYLAGLGSYKSDVLEFWTDVREVLTNCFYSGVMIVFSVLRCYS